MKGIFHMKKIIALISALCLMSFSSGYLPSDFNDVISASAAASENNTKENASLLESGNTVSAALADKSDTDWYKAVLDSDGIVNFSFEHDTVESSSTYMNVYIYQSDGATEVYSLSLKGNAALTSTPDIGLPAGSYYVKIVWEKYDFVEMPYNLNYSFKKSAVCETEDNNSKSAADPIELNTDYTGSTITGSDADWYKFSVDKKGYTQISFTHDTLESSSVYWVVNLYKSDGTTLIHSIDVKGNAETSKFPKISLETGDYYIKVMCNNIYTFSNMNYFLNAGFTADDTWETEPNDKKTEASAIKENTTYTGTIMNGNDADFYKLTLDEAKVLNINFEHDTIDDSSVYWIAGLYESDGTTLINSFQIKGNEGSVKNTSVSLDKGTYYLKVSPRSSYSYLSYEYYLTVNTKSPKNWETEKNDTKNTANAIELNTSYNFSSMSSDDADWFKFSAENDGKFSLSFEHDTVENKSTVWTVGIYESDATTLIHEMNVSGTAALTKTPVIGLPAGDYFVKIKPNSYYWLDMDASFTVNYTASELCETEDNDSKAKADSININSIYTGTLMTSNDADWYKFDSAEDQNLKIIFNHDGNGDKTSKYWTVSVYESDGTTLITSEDIYGQATETSIQENFKKGTYYIKVINYPYYHLSDEYSLTVSDKVTETKLGDVDGDGLITSADALQVLQMVVGTTELNYTGDVDGDGQITSADALQILNYVVGNISSF